MEAKEIDQELCFMVNAPDCWLCLFSSKGNFYPSLYLAPEYSNSEHNVIGLNSINSVHQLQNLYFALTGEELTLKQ